MKGARKKTGGGKKVERKKTIVTTAKAKKQQDEQPPHRLSKYVGVNWDKQMKKWKASIRIDGKMKSLGYCHDEKEAACMYDMQAALLGKPVNFPLHEGMEQAVKPIKDRSKVPNVNRPSKYVGVNWHKQNKMWQAQITIDGKQKSLGLYHDEKEAARMYDEQAALLGKPVNFPLHEGMEQAVKRAPKGSGKRMQKSRAKSSNDDEDESDDESMEEQNNDETLDDDSDEIDDPIIMDADDRDDQQASFSSSSAFLHQLVAQRTAFVEVKQELTDNLATSHQQQHVDMLKDNDADIKAASLPCPYCNEPIDREENVVGLVVA